MDSSSQVLLLQQQVGGDEFVNDDITFRRIARINDIINSRQRQSINSDYPSYHQQCAQREYQHMIQILHNYRPTSPNSQRQHEELLQNLHAQLWSSSNYSDGIDSSDSITDEAITTTATTTSSPEPAAAVVVATTITKNTIQPEIERLAIRTSEILVLDQEEDMNDSTESSDDLDYDDDEDLELECPICCDPLLTSADHDDDDDDDDDQPIKDNANIAVTQKCKHVFHEHCLLSWLNTKKCKENRHCPICRELISETDNMCFVYDQCNVQVGMKKQKDESANSCNNNYYDKAIYDNNESSSPYLYQILKTEATDLYYWGIMVFLPVLFIVMLWFYCITLQDGDCDDGSS